MRPTKKEEMPALRSIISDRSLAGYLAVMCIVSLSSSLAQIEGRKCVCTSKSCREAGVYICRTKFSCYTEFISTEGRESGESTTTRGCTEGATPLLCETKSWVTRPRSVSSVEPLASPRIRVPWPRLKCCDSHDYCNADDEINGSTWTSDRKVEDLARFSVDFETQNSASMNLDTMSTVQQQTDRNHEDSKADDKFVRNRVRTLYAAALILAVAALISVLASCYVVTRSARFSLFHLLIDAEATNLRVD